MGTFKEDLERDWGNPEIYGPWTKELEKNDPPLPPGKFKFYKKYYLIDKFSEEIEIEQISRGK